MNSYTSKIIAPVIVGLTCFVLAAFSTQSQAVVVFSVFSSAAEIDGKTENGLEQHFKSYSSSAEVFSLPGSASVFDTVMVGLEPPQAGAMAESAASVILDPVQTVGNRTTLTGGLSSSAQVYESFYRNWYSEAGGSAFFDVRFSLDDTYSYVFDGLLMEAGGDADVTYNLNSLDYGTEIFGGSLKNSSDTSFTGTLLAGDYFLYMEVLSNARIGSRFPIGFANGDFRFSLTAPSAVPAPATVWLFASGLLVMLLVSRRREV